MDKVFKSLERIGKCYVPAEGCVRYGETYRDHYKIVEQALLELKAIKEADPSEALQYIDKILSNFGNAQIETMTLSKCDILSIKQALQQAFAQVEQNKLLEQEVGCPLEVRCNIYTDTFIYDEKGDPYEVEHIDKECFSALKVGGWGSGIDYDFKWKDYKHTWWLREDKSE